MLKLMLDKNVLFVLMGVMGVLGIVSKMIESFALKRLVRAAGNMSKSNHSLMRLVRAKFEHACMVSDTVENVPVFVDKYLYEYRVLGMKLHSWQRMGMTAAGVCLVAGVAGAAAQYSVYNLQDPMLVYVGIGVALAIFLYVLHKMTDEAYRIEVIRNYMVDYLQNVCLHRYEKTYPKERETDKNATADTDRQEPMRPQPGREVPSPRTKPEITPPAMPEPYDVPDVTPPIQAATMQAAMPQGNMPQTNMSQVNMSEASMPQASMSQAKIPQANMSQGQAAPAKKKEIPNDAEREVRIRQILEEFMA